MKREATEQEKIFVLGIIDKGLAFRIYKGLQNKKQKTNNPGENWVRDFSNSQKKKSERPINVKKYSASLAIREMQVKNPTRMAKIKKHGNTSYRLEYRAIRTLTDCCIAIGSVSWC